MSIELTEREGLARRLRTPLLLAASFLLLFFMLEATGLPAGFRHGLFAVTLLVTLLVRYRSDFFFDNRVWGHFVLITASVIALFPMIWILSASFKPRPELLSDLGIIPQNPTVQNYVYLLTQKPFLTWFFNSVLVALATTAFGLTFATTAAFALSQHRFPGRRSMLRSILFIEMFPGAILIIPLYAIFKSLGLIDSYLGLIIAYTTVSLPFSVWMMKGFFDTIPASIMEAARIDGLSTFGIFRRVVLPLSLPGISVTAFFSFITAWNEFMFANTFMNDNKMMTLTVGMKTFIAEQQTYWEYLTPGAILITLPVLLFFLFAQRWLISGLTSGGVKG